MTMLSLIFKVGQVIGVGATTFIAYILIKEPSHEKRTWLRATEIAVSIAGALSLAAEFLIG